MSSKKSILTTLNEFKNEYYGLRGTAKRGALETGFERFKKEAVAPSTSISPPSLPPPRPLGSGRRERL